MGSMKRISIAGLTCRNERCPKWCAWDEEHCHKKEQPSEEWIKKYCDNQPKEKRKKAAQGNLFGRPGKQKRQRPQGAR